MSARMIFGVLATQGAGFVLDPKIDHERAAYDLALISTGEVFAHYDLADMPPMLAFAFAWGQVGVIMLNKEENKPLLDKAKTKLFSWWGARKGAAAANVKG